MLRAADVPLLSWDKGFASDSRLLNPGKLDFLYRYRSDQSIYNLMAWTPSAKMGAGAVDVEGKGVTTYGGGFIRPLAAWTNLGDLILGGQTAQSPTRGDYELQGEYRFPFGLGLGGGYVDALNPTNDVVFGKLSLRNKLAGSWRYVLAAQWQEVNHRASPGGYLALYNDQFMGVGGYDGEQWRATAGWVAPESWGKIRPTLEVLYVDNSIGEFTGPRQLFVNATLGYRGGFLSHPARLGRAMGPQGLEFGNPLGFLVPTWNRRLEVWEMGELLDLRLEWLRLPDRTTQERYEALGFPFQFDRHKSALDYLFLGGYYVSDPTKSTGGFLGGVHGKVGFLKFSAGVDYQVNPSQTTVIIGVIDVF